MLVKRQRLQGIGEAAVFEGRLPHPAPKFVQGCREVAPHLVRGENGGVEVRQPVPLEIGRDFEPLAAIQDVLDCRLDRAALAIGAIAFGQGEIRHRDLRRKAWAWLSVFSRRDPRRFGGIGGTRRRRGPVRGFGRRRAAANAMTSIASPDSFAS